MRQINKSEKTVSKSYRDVDEGGRWGGAIQKRRAKRAKRRLDKNICEENSLQSELANKEYSKK